MPGSGSGDKVPMMLPSGSFVMNRNAVGFQSGGIIPTMLEPGEQVYGPGQWGPGHQLMNSMMPRFQNGGVVEATHPDTGPGWSPGKDGQGRPAVFTKSGAEAWAKMMKQSNGAVKTSDINSSQRTVAKNEAVGGVANSRHLTGNAVDVQTGSSSWVWMKQNDGKNGWNFNNYDGPQGWHWDYTGGGGGNVVTPGKEGKVEKENDNNILNNFGSILQGLGSLGSYTTKIFGAILEGFGGGLSNAMGLSGLGGLISGAGQGVGNIPDAISGLFGGGESYTGQSTSLSGSTKDKAKMMYDYIKGKGYTSAQAKGIIANIYRESSFDPSAVGDSGTSHGLFQMHAGRSSAMRNSVPNWSTNWKGQIDQGLNNDVGPQYKSATAGMSAGDAAYWWQTKFERPADQVAGGPNDRKQRDFIASLGFQKGGVVNMKGSQSASSSRFAKAQSEFAKEIGRAAAPIIIPMPTPSGGGSPGGGGGTSGATNNVPTLPDGPSSLQSAEYFYRLNMGTAF